MFFDYATFSYLIVYIFWLCYIQLLNYLCILTELIYSFIFEILVFIIVTTEFYS